MSERSKISIFISYSHHDHDFLLSRDGEPEEFLRILNGLTRHDVDIEFDRGFLTAGALWADEIPNRLDRCDIILPILSDEFLQSDYCTRIEVPAILERRLAGHDVMIAPFYYRYCVWQGIDWIAERDVPPPGGKPFQAIESA